jgi:hypothetical protein
MNDQVSKKVYLADNGSSYAIVVQKEVGEERNESREFTLIHNLIGKVRDRLEESRVEKESEW